MLRGLRLTSGYTGLVASSVLDPDDPTTQRIAGVAWREAGYTWTRTPDHMPRARLVSTAQPSADITADVHRIDLARVALVDAPVEGLSARAAASDTGSARVVEDRPGSIVVETVSGGPAAARADRTVSPRMAREPRTAQREKRSASTATFSAASSVRADIEWR